MRWSKDLKANVRFNEPLSEHTTLQIGGPADIWVEPYDFKALSEVVCWCVQKSFPYLVIGRGSNILFSDRGFRGAVISLSSCAFTKMEVKGERISCGAGLSLHKLLRETQKRGLGRLEFLAGIPASIGGALVMNAGARGANIGDLVEQVKIMDRNGRIRILRKKELKFGYRQSNLARFIVLEALLKLVKRSSKKIKKDIMQHFSRKRKTQDLASKSAGCVFKNPRYHLTAAEMIELCSLKRRRKGQAEISSLHANYIINRNGASSRDILYLMALAQREVHKRFGVHLEPEIKIVN